MIDENDPVVVLLTWGLTWAVGQTGQRIDPRVRRSLPLVAVLIAVGVRAALEVADGQVVTLETLVRALSAAGVAVLGHSQAREVAKLWRLDPEAQTAPVAPTEDQADSEGLGDGDGSSGASGA